MPRRPSGGSRSPALSVLAGPDALRILRDRGLRAEDVDVVPGAGGGPKWLVLEALDRFLFGEFLQQPRERPLHLIGSSIGAWRLACLAQRDPVAAIGRLKDAYLGQGYNEKPTPAEVSEESTRILDRLLGEHGAEEILSHPWARLHVITAECRGAAASEWLPMLGLAMATAAAANMVSRRGLALQIRRVIFHTAGDASPFRALRDFPTRHVRLTRGNLRPALLASGSIPLVLEGVRIPGAERTVYRDGGIVDYHPDFEFGPGEGLVLYPHFFRHIVPGWFDKALPWRRGHPRNFRRAVILAPSADFVAGLPGGAIPDRKDFYRMSEPERLAAWNAAVDAGEALAEELRTLIEMGDIAGAARPL